MKKNRILSLGLTALMLSSSMMSAGSVVGSAEESTSAYEDELVLEVYSAAANYQGMQTGWFAQIIKEKFNISLNIIAPNVSGDSASLYQTRCASGALGDIIILDNSDMADCIEAGLIADISETIYDYENLANYQTQIDAFNASVDSAEEGEIYAIPCQMNSIGSTAIVEETTYDSIRVPWDYYLEAGAPTLDTLDDLLDLLETMQTNHPTNSEGDSAYAISLWSDWDGDTLSNVVELVRLYGQEANGSILLGNDNSIMDLTSTDGAYYKILKFYNQAYLRGLVDPDSGTQDWDTVCDKMTNKRVYLLWYNWSRGFWNTAERGEQGDYYVTIPISDENIYAEAATYWGDGRCWAIGSQVSEENQTRIMEFLDWLASPEALVLQHAGPEGVVYTVNEDGTYTLTEEGKVRNSEDVYMPDEMGGGTLSDGQCQINQWIVAAIETNPLTGETYSPDYWASTVEENQMTATIEWSEMFGAANEVEYYLANDLITVVPSVNVSLETDSTDIAIIRSDCATVLCDSSWQMIFASSEEEFEQMWENMCATLTGLGWDELVEFDAQKYQVVIDARIAALE